MSAACLYVMNIRPALQASHQAGLDDGWKDGFPPLDQPWQVPLWLLSAHTGRGFAWPVGDNHFGSLLTFVLWAAGLASSWRRGNRWVWALFVAPQAMSLAAAFLHKYPYLANPRICMFLGPGICLFFGAGLQYCAGCLRPERRRPVYGIAAAALILCAGGGVAHDIVNRVRELKGPGIRSTLAQASRQLGPNGQFVVLNRGNDSGVFNYYIRRGVKQKVCFDPKLLEPIGSAERLALVAGAGASGEAARDKFLEEFEKQSGKSVKIAWSQTARQVLQADEDSYAVWICE